MARILVADDSADLLESIEYILKNNGHEPHTADCTERFFELLQEINPDIILIDVKLNNSDGRLLCYKIRKGPWESVPVIFMSAFPDLLEDYELFGASASIEKPFSTDKILGLMSLFIRQTHSI